MTMLAAVVAMAHGRVIGKRNEMPWYLPADFRHFREITTGHSVIMGRNTADSILNRNGQPLPHRKNIVITRDQTYHPDGFIITHSLDEALKAAGDDAYIIGGAQIYQLSLSLLDRVYATEVDTNVDGDALFPELNTNEWREVERESHKKDEKNPYDYSFVTFDRMR